MKNLLRGLTLAVALGVLIAGGVAHAAPHHTTINTDSLEVLAVNEPFGDSAVISESFYIPRGSRSYYLVAAFSDTNSGAAGGTDSITVALQKGVYVTSSDVLAPDSVWETVVALNPLMLSAGAATLATQRYLSPDSTDVGAFEVGGAMRWIVYAGQTGAGAGEDADTMTCPYTIECYIECEGKD